jgi:hypothetical protein
LWSNIKAEIWCERVRLYEMDVLSMIWISQIYEMKSYRDKCGYPLYCMVTFQNKQGKGHCACYNISLYMQKIIYIPCVGDPGLNDNLSRGRFYLYWRVEAASMFKGKGAFEVFAFFPQYLITTMQRTLKLVLTVLCICFNIMP